MIEQLMAQRDKYLGNSLVAFIKSLKLQLAHQNILCNNLRHSIACLCIGLLAIRVHIDLVIKGEYRWLVEA